MSSHEVHRFRRQPPYLYVGDLIFGRRVLEIGSSDGAGAQYLLALGAASVLGVDRLAQHVGAARARHRLENLEFRIMDYGALELEDRSFDVVCVPGGGELLRWLGFLEEVRRVLTQNGHLIVTERSADHPAAQAGVSYYEMLDRLEPLFGGARMIGISPFVGCSLVEYAPAAVEVGELELDTSLLPHGASPGPVVEYMAVAGPSFGPPRGFLVVQLPSGEAITALSQGGAEERPEAWGEGARLAERLRAAETQLEEAARLDEERTEREREQERVQDEQIALLTERDAYIAQLRGEVEEAHSFIETQKEQLAAALAVPVVGEAAVARAEGLAAALAEQRATAEMAIVRGKDAEGKSDELWRKIGEMQKELESQREQAVESVRAQRQAAQAALTRAMDEAAKKLVSVRDEVLRTERERDAAEKANLALKEEVTRATAERDAAMQAIKASTAAREAELLSGPAEVDGP